LPAAVAPVPPKIGRATEPLRARAEVAGFSATFRHAREQAITTRQPYTVTVNPSNRLVIVTTGEDEVRWTRALSSRVDIRADTPSSLAVRFDPQGTSRGGGVRLGPGKVTHPVLRDPRTRARPEPARMRAAMTLLARPGSRRAQQGFTLLEVLIAFAILSLAVVAVIQGFAQGLRLLKVAGDHQQAVLVADQKIREMVIPVEGRDQGREGNYDWERTVTVAPAPDLPPAE